MGSEKFYNYQTLKTQCRIWSEGELPAGGENEAVGKKPIATYGLLAIKYPEGKMEIEGLKT